MKPEDAHFPPNVNSPLEAALIKYMRWQESMKTVLAFYTAFENGSRNIELPPRHDLRTRLTNGNHYTTLQQRDGTEKEIYLPSEGISPGTWHVSGVYDSYPHQVDPHARIDSFVLNMRLTLNNSSYFIVAMAARSAEIHPDLPLTDTEIQDAVPALIISANPGEDFTAYEFVEDGLFQVVDASRVELIADVELGRFVDHAGGTS